MNTKLKCLLLDDELLALQYLKLCCEEIPDLEIVKVFNQADVFLEQYESLDFDFCIIDIEMPKFNGLEVAKRLKNKAIIFTTAYKDFAFEAFELEAIDYIQKPVNKERLLKAIEKIRQNLKNVPLQKSLPFNTDKGKTFLFLDQILYVKSSEIDPRDKIIVLEDRTSLTLKNVSFEKLQQILAQNQFCRINKKEIIALKAVKLFSSDEITTTISLKNGSPLKLILSGIYRTEFIKKLSL
ncbi:MAG: response regulator transcription factor [Bacteroidota bacterium]